MKKQIKIAVSYQVLATTLVCTMLSGCSTLNRIYSDNDIVYSTKRFELKYEYKDRDRRTPVYYFTQSIVKEADQNNNVSFHAYDVLYLTSSGFNPDGKVILIIENKPYPMVIDKIEHENLKTISENTTQLRTSDSTTVPATRGYTENNRKITRMSYKIPVSTVNEIKKADQLSIRYYAGPAMITVKPGKLSIRKIKELIDIE